MTLATLLPFLVEKVEKIRRYEMRITIITVVFNNREFISDCINSVLSQDYNDVEYIIIDGGSNDGTLEIIRSFTDRDIKVISEPDEGIYDAMNKGIGVASGEVIGILNADDFYVKDDVLTRVNKIFSDQEIQASYADVEYVRRNNVKKVIRKWESGAFVLKNFFYGWSPPHPTFFVRRNVLLKYGLYNKTLRISADYEMMLRLLFVNQVKCFYLPDVIIRMRDGGISNKSLVNRIQANREDKLAWEINKVKAKPYTIGLKPLRKIIQFFTTGRSKT